MGKRIVPVLWAIAICVVSYGCSSSLYSSYSQRDRGQASLIVSTYDEVAQAVSLAISDVFPTSKIAADKYPNVPAFRWSDSRGSSTTEYVLSFSKRKGRSLDGKSVEGWAYDLSVKGRDGGNLSLLISTINSRFNKSSIDQVPVSSTEFFSLSESRSPTVKDDGVLPANVAMTGTGFFVSASGHFVTNSHVVDGASAIKILFGGVYVSASVVSVDKPNDVALLKADVKSVPLRVLRTDGVRRGNEVFTLGFPSIGILGQEQKATFGRVNALSGVRGDPRFFQIDVPIQPGNSGGPVITDGGEVIGMVTASLNQGYALREIGVLAQSVNYAVKSEYILALLAASRISSHGAVRSSGALKSPDSFEKSVILVVATQ